MATYARKLLILGRPEQEGLAELGCELKATSERERELRGANKYREHVSSGCAKDTSRHFFPTFRVSHTIVLKCAS